MEMCLPLGTFSFPKSLIILSAVVLLALLEAGDTLDISDKSSRSPLSLFFPVAIEEAIAVQLQ